MFAVANKFVTVMATTFGGAASGVLATSSPTDTIEFDSFASNFGQHIANVVYTFFYNIILTIGAFALSFIDLIQLIVYKFLGISYDLSGFKAFDQNNPLIKFIMNDTVTTVLRSAISVALVLVIVFSIYAIIRGEYNKAANDQEYNVKRVWARALRAVFGMLIFPAVFLGVIILTNAILASFAYVLAGNTNTTMGNQVFAVSTYNANAYRNYANNNVRIPIYVDFEDPYDKGYGNRYSTEELVAVYDAFASDGKELYNMFAEQTFPKFAETYTYANNSISNNKDTYGKYEKFICTREQYYVMAEFIDYAVTNGVTFHYKALTDADIDWQYVDSAVFDKEAKMLTITYKDATKNDGTSYTVSYVSSSYELTSPVQDAIHSLKSLLSLQDNTIIDPETKEIQEAVKFKILDYMDGSINRVQWASNKVKIQLSSHYNDKEWTPSDQLILYEYYRWAYNNIFENYTIEDLRNGVYIDLYNIELQFFRSYQNRYVTLASYDGAVINGTYYKVTPLIENGEYVYDDYGDLIYALDTSAYDISADKNNILTNLSAYNNGKTEEEKLGTKIECRKDSEDAVNGEAWYSAIYDKTGNLIPSQPDDNGYYQVGNVFAKSIINTKGRKFAEATEEENEKYGLVDANGFYKTVDRVKATRSIKEVSWPSKLVGDLKAIYRDLNINQLITTGEWLDTFVSHMDSNVTEFLVDPNSDVEKIIKTLGTSVTGQLLVPEMKTKLAAAGISFDASKNAYKFGTIGDADYNQQLMENTAALYNAYSDSSVSLSSFRQAIINKISGGYLSATQLANVIASLGNNFAVSRLSDSVKTAFDNNKSATEDELYVYTKEAVYEVYENFVVGSSVVSLADYGVSRTTWMDNIKANCATKTQEYVSTFDTSLISPQGLIFSEIFLGEIAESDGSTLSSYMFKSKYSDQQIRALMLALLGEEYYETATITINYFVDYFNQLFAPLLERIMAGEGQPITVGEVMNIQLYTYKAYLASVILSDDNARFMLDIARSFVDMYAFSYDILASDPNSNAFALNLIREYADVAYGTSSGKIPYLITLEEIGINWKNYFLESEVSAYQDGEAGFKQFLINKFRLTETARTQLDIAESELPTNLINAITSAVETKYMDYADMILWDNLRLYDVDENGKFVSNGNDASDIQYGLVWTLTENDHTYELGEYLNDKLNITYDKTSKYLVRDGKYYHTWSQLGTTIYSKLADAVYSVQKADLNKDNSTTRFGILLKHAKQLLSSQRITSSSSSYPAYLKIFEAYITGQSDSSDSTVKAFLARHNIIMSQNVKIERIEGIFNEYKDYLSRLESAEESRKTFVNNLTIAFSIEGGIEIDRAQSIRDFVKYYYNNIDQFVSDHSSDGLVIDSWKVISSYDEFMSLYNTYLDGVSNNVTTYKKQSDNISNFTEQINRFYEYFFYGCQDEEGKQARIELNKQNYRGLSAIYSFSSIASSLISNQNMVDSFHKYFLTYAVRMQATERATKMFTVVVNNHAYDLAITMPTAKLVEYVIGGQYLGTLGFETMFTDEDYTGFLDIGYGQKLPKTGEKTTFGTINQFLNNLATITVDAYYTSNLKNLTDANKDSTPIQTLHYGLNSTEYYPVVISPDVYNYNEQPLYMQLILQSVFGSDGLLADKYLLLSKQGVAELGDNLPSNWSKMTEQEQITKLKTVITAPNLELSDILVISKLFDSVLGYLTNSNQAYSKLSMQEIRRELLDSLYNYQTYSSDTAEEDTARYVALFRLFCSDFEYTKVSANETKIEYRQNQATKSIMMRLSGLKDKPEEMMVNLEYKSLYDEVGYDEQYGDYFILCSFDETRQTYYPIMMTNKTRLSDYTDNHKTNENGDKIDWTNAPVYFGHSDYYDGDGAVAYPILAKGIMTEDGYPTAIRQINGVTEFYRKNVIIRNASEIGLSSYYMNVEQVSVSMNIFQRFTNAISKLFTGKTLIEHAYSSRKMLKITSNLAFPMGVETQTTTLSNEGIAMHYYTMMLGINIGGLSASSFYSTLKIDIVILILAILALVPLLLKALWGVFGRIIDVTVYYMASPVMFSTIALGQDVKNDNGTKEETKIFTEWRNTIFKKVVSVFGYVFAFQMFFILVPFIYNFTLITDVSAFQSVRMFSWVSINFVNQIVRVIFLICSVYLLTSAPKLFAEIMNQLDGIAEGEKMASAVKANFNELKDVVSGQKMVDSTNYAREQLKQMIPGYEIAIAVQDKIQETKAKVVGAVAQVAGTVMKVIPEASQYADMVKKAGKEYKEKTLERLEAKKALREEKKAEGQKYLDRYGVSNGLISKDEEAHLKASKENENSGYNKYASQAQANIEGKKKAKRVAKRKKRSDKKEKKAYLKDKKRNK